MWQRLQPHVHVHVAEAAAPCGRGGSPTCLPTHLLRIHTSRLFVGSLPLVTDAAAVRKALGFGMVGPACSEWPSWERRGAPPWALRADTAGACVALRTLEERPCRVAPKERPRHGQPPRAEVADSAAPHTDVQPTPGGPR